VSGASRDGRAELATILQFLRPGDELVVSLANRVLAHVCLPKCDVARECAGKDMRMLANPRDPPTEPGRVRRRKLFIADQDASAFRQGETSHQGKQGRLAHTAGGEQCNMLAGRDLEVRPELSEDSSTVKKQRPVKVGTFFGTKTLPSF